LEQSGRESEQLGHDHIGQAHLLQALVELGAGTGVEILLSLGVDLDQLAAVTDSLARREELESAPSRPAFTVHSGYPTGGLADQRRQLAEGLVRYGRPDDGCDPVPGCTCGLGPLLILANEH
jgi:ATP-dependent Clp protease ATP-binding subunit ClpA